MRRADLLLMALLGGSATAGWVDENGASLPDSEDRKAVGDFGAQLVFVADEQALFKQWAIPSAIVDLDTVDGVAVNQSISAFVVFSGCEPTAKGLCDVSMQLRIIRPDGEISYETPAMEVWQDKPPPPERALQLSARYLKFALEPHDQRGRYTIQARVRDGNTGAVLSLQKAFVASDAQSPEKPNLASQGTLPDRPAQSP